MDKRIKSPIQMKPGNPLFLVKLAADLLKVHNQFLEKVDEFVSSTKVLQAEGERIKSLPKGDKGDRGERGPQGLPGKDGRDGLPGRDGDMPDITMIADLVAKQLPQPKDGKDAAVDYEKILKELKKLSIDDFPAINAAMASYRNQLAGKVYGKDTWARGGGDTVTAGVNVTITTDANGNKVINASGGTSGANVTTQYQLTAVQAGSDVTIDLTQLTNWATFVSLIAVYRNNIPQTETINFTVVGSTLTIFGADASEIFNATYAYTS